MSPHAAPVAPSLPAFAPLDTSDAPPWQSEEVSEVFSRLESSEQGLSSKQAAERLTQHGPNALQRTSGDSPLKILWRQINNALIWVLLGSSAVAVALGKITDGLVVLAVVVLNSIIGFIQEYRASRAIEALRDMVPELASAMRAGHAVMTPVAGLVPGDVITLAS